MNNVETNPPSELRLLETGACMCGPNVHCGCIPANRVLPVDKAAAGAALGMLQGHIVTAACNHALGRTMYALGRTM